jgi:UDP-glucuronate 4-epimerase
VTGAAGFIGSHVSRQLLEHGHDVVGLDNLDPFYDRALKEPAVNELSDFDRFTFVPGDVRDAGTLSPALSHVDTVIHLAARGGVRPSIENPEPYVSINLAGTVSLLDCCRRVGVRRVVFGSSSSVYGNDTPAPFREDAPCLNPISPYAATKRSAELHCQMYARVHGMRIAALRFFTVYGPRQRPDLAIHRFTSLLTHSKPVPQYGDGSTERDYTWIDDIVHGIEAGVNWTNDPSPAFEVFNLGGAQTIRLDGLINLIAEAIGTEPIVHRLPAVAGDVRRTCADISKARRILGFNPRVSIKEGIPRFVEWYQRARERSLV